MLTFSLSLLLIVWYNACYSGMQGLYSQAFVLEQFCINFCKFNVTIAMMKMEWLAFHYT